MSTNKIQMQHDTKIALHFTTIGAKNFDFHLNVVSQLIRVSDRVQAQSMFYRS